MPADTVSQALDDISDALAANADDERLLARRITTLRKAHDAGRSWRAAIARQGSPGVLALTARIVGRLGEGAARLRRALAGALRREGLTVTQIAETFGVSHQRASVLLHEGLRDGEQDPQQAQT